MLVPHLFKSHLLSSVVRVAVGLGLMAAAAFPQVRDNQQFSGRGSILSTDRDEKEWRGRPHPLPPRVGIDPRDGAVSPTAPIFSLQVYDGGGIRAQTVATGDLNGDGWPDLAVANACTISWMSCTGGGSVGVFINVGGSFSGPGVYPSGGNYTGGIGIADVNGDGKADVVVASSCNGGDPSCIATGELLGNGDGSLQAVEPYSGPVANASWSDVSDFNGDGILDQAWASGVDSPGGVVYVQLGNRDGTYQPAVPYGSGGSYAIAAVVIDVNGDGHPDIVALNQCANAGTCMFAGATGSVGVLINNGDGTFEPAVSFSTGGVGSNSITVADVSRDGKPDLLVANECNNQGICPKGNGTLGVLINGADYIATSTTLASSANPSSVRQVVNFRATVQPYSGSLPEGGLVTFRDGTRIMGTVPLRGGVASFTTRGLPAGTHDVTASYVFDGVYGASTGKLAEVVKSIRGDATALALTASPNPAYAEAVTFTATVTSTAGVIPDGELVTFFDGTTVIGSGATVGGVATLVALLSASVHNIRAVYPGDTKFKASAGGVIEQVYSGKSTGIQLSASTNVSTYGQAVTFWAIVYSKLDYNPPYDLITGTVEFRSGDLEIGSATLEAPAPGASTASITTSALPPGTYSIEAVYSGDPIFAPSTSSPLSLVVQPATSQAMLISPANPSTSGQSVNFTATVTSPTVGYHRSKRIH